MMWLLGLIAAIAVIAFFDNAGVKERRGEGGGTIGKIDVALDKASKNIVKGVNNALDKYNESETKQKFDGDSALEKWKEESK
ncbi:MAG: hypothetical protein AAGU27_16235 [Dehalobacterium sp.]